MSDETSRNPFSPEFSAALEAAAGFGGMPATS